MAGFDDDKKPKVFNFGDDDDDFVVPDHIQDIINEIHGSDPSTAGNPPNSPDFVGSSQDNLGNQQQVNPPGQENPETGEPAQENIVTFEEREEDIYIVPPESPAPQNQEPVNEIKVESTSITIEKTNETPPVNNDSSEEEPKKEEPDFTSFSSLPPRKSEDSIFDKPPEHHDESPKVKLPKKKTIRPLKKIMAVFLVGAIGISSVYYGYSLYSKQATESKEVLGSTSQASIQDTVKKVGEIVQLADATEQPSEVANIEDTSRLSSNAFFDRAKNGDIVLIYPVSKIAVLFRPSTSKVIAIGPVDSGTQVTPTPTLIPSEEELADPTITVSPTKNPSPAAQSASGSAQTGE
jgi:hypothetical protein